jgi:fumarate hydratase class II
MDIERIKSIMPRLYELAIGGTAVGTGVNTHPEFGKRVAEAISKETGIPFRETGNHFSAQSSMDTAVELSGALKTLAVSLYKIANDIRWMNSGPQAGLAEIQLPSLQPGSSIMPGKVNPVIPEAVMMVAMQVIGNDTAITLAGASGNFELNVSLPIIAHNLIQSIEILGNACDIFVGKCIVGIVPDRKRMERIAGQNAILATILTPYIGYDKASEIVKRAIEGGKTVRDVVIEMKLFKDEDVDKIFDIRKMT